MDQITYKSDKGNSMSRDGKRESGDNNGENRETLVWPIKTVDI